MSSAVAGYSGAFGFDGPPPAYADIALADCFLLLGTNTAACHPILWSRIRDRQGEGAFVICADPRPTPTAQRSDLHLPVRPGTDLALLSALLHVVDRDGLLDDDFIAPPHERLGGGAGRRARVVADARRRRLRRRRRTSSRRRRTASPAPAARWRCGRWAPTSRPSAR